MPSPRLFIYVVDRDFGFAPNPFHGKCTLATCKPRIRRSAEVGDWIAGVGGRRLKATGRCVFAMRVAQKLTFQQYWEDPEFLDKRPVRNGTFKMLVGDNIYHQSSSNESWIQEDSHHSHLDGTTNMSNLRNDTSADAVLVSDVHYYFGKSAPEVPSEIFESLGYKNARNYRVYPMKPDGERFVSWVESSFPEVKNMVHDDPFDFENSHARYSAETNKVNV